MNEKILEVINLKKHFPIKKGIIFEKNVGAVKAVDGLSFTVNKGETFGLVGESGCGKSTTGRLLLQLLKPTEGQVIFEGKDLSKLNPEEMRKMRQELQMIFQDPYASLNPRKNVEQIIMEPLVIHNIGTMEEKKKRVKELLDIVGLDASFAGRYPHEFSGGQRQRIGIARALAVKPKIIVCDEPVSALDVSIQAQIINLLEELQEEFGFTYIFIAHDLSVVKHISDRIAVMYLGKIVELASYAELFSNPKHPYTKALLSSIPVPNPRHKGEKIVLEGDVPSPINPPSGCHFHTRCRQAKDICKQKSPKLIDYGNGHYASCLLLEEGN
ncbi:oligopeptide transport system ATP-binding protein [Desulfonispora thiosulfatigenes DSM 11270]|uniref:Oligopeptide transport system ATP-binding protein n=1 Tax=Desulfonispora thiosulfatigenes DSM 11270 TaxID=656914 RepID=A0A1W1UKF5_DESTI|nr:dipeptide ABC transporter ATP-binding protein [Desulfonispora thiosulfatigenes]SMB81560.1 oligopeptide transport system ATP-binding protein [Desulfonispora thiosulfatigenes DSM 11270]